MATIQGPPVDVRIVAVERRPQGFRVHPDKPVPAGGLTIGFFIAN